MELATLQSTGTCLLVMSSAGSFDIANYTGSVSAASFIAAVTLLTERRITVAVATPNGALPEFHHTDVSTERWVRDNRQLFSHPLILADVAKQDNVLGYCGLVFPSALGAVSDLANDVALGGLVRKFAQNKKPICAVGYGVAGLCKAFADNDKWCFSGWNLTAISNFEVARYPFFSKLPLIVEDYVRDHGGFYNNAPEDEAHVIVDRTLVTGQNDNSTSLAIYNFAYLVSAKGS